MASIEVGTTGDVFRAFELEDTLERLRTVWDLSYSIPLPRETLLHCPQCGAEDAIPRKWKFHLSGGSPNPWRCDVMFKCVVCGRAWVHGIVVPEEDYEAHAGESYDRRQAEGVLREEGWAP